MSLCKGGKMELADESLLRRRKYCLYTQHGDVPWYVWFGLGCSEWTGWLETGLKRVSPRCVILHRFYRLTHTHTHTQCIHVCSQMHINVPVVFCVFHFFHGEEVGCHAKNVGALPRSHTLGDSKQQSTLHYICNKDVKRIIEWWGISTHSLSN